MLFPLTRSALADVFGEGRLATLPTAAFPSSSADTAGARFLQTVGVPTGTLWLREPDEDSGRLPLVQDVVAAEDFEGTPEDAGGWAVIGWLLNAHLALDPCTGARHRRRRGDRTGTPRGRLLPRPGHRQQT